MPTEKRKRGRPKTGRALTHAEVQPRYRERRYARLAAEGDGPQWDVPELHFPDAMTLDELMATVSPAFRGELMREAAREEARRDEDEDDANES